MLSQGALVQSIRNQSSHVIEDMSGGSLQAKIDEDFRRLAEPTSGITPLPVLRIWTNSQGLVTTRRLARRNDFARTASFFGESGWPVGVRRTGGATMALGPGALNISLFHRTCTLKPDHGFQPLVRLLTRALQHLGIDPVTGTIPGAICSGSYDLSVRGRKIGGLAAYARRRVETYWLVHATVFVNCDLDSFVGRVSEFERMLGHKPRYRRAQHANLVEFADARVGEVQ